MIQFAQTEFISKDEYVSIFFKFNVQLIQPPEFQPLLGYFKQIKIPA